MRVIDVDKTRDNLNELIRDNCKIAPLARKMGISPKAIYKWFEGKSLPSLDRLVELSGILGCSLNELIIVKEI